MNLRVSVTCEFRRQGPLHGLQDVQTILQIGQSGVDVGQLFLQRVDLLQVVPGTAQVERVMERREPPPRIVVDWMKHLARRAMRAHNSETRIQLTHIRMRIDSRPKQLGETVADIHDTQFQSAASAPKKTNEKGREPSLHGSFSPSKGHDLSANTTTWPRTIEMPRL